LTKRHIIILITLLLLIPASYILLKRAEPKKVIIIPQLNIVSVEKKPVVTESPTDILSKFKLAVSSAKEKAVPTQEEEALKILATLQKSTKELTEVQEDKKVVTEEVTLPKKIILEKKTIIKKEIIKKTTPKKLVEKKIVVKKAIAKKTIIKKQIVQKQPAKKSTTQKTKPKTVHVKIVKKPTQKQRPVTKKPTAKKLSREEEVALYKKQHQHGLEIVGESVPFVLNAEKNTPADSHYFEPIKKKQNQTKNETIGFVKTLGVVEVSNQYEVGNVEISQKVELAREGIVDISSATIETDELKALKFVAPLEVLEVSPSFETIDAKKYIK